jgi:hypothetical protein
VTSALSRGSEDEVDREALLCALVLSPLTFPRNRFFRLFSLPGAKSTRFRAAHIRSILRHLAEPNAEPTRAKAFGTEDRGAVVRYEVPRLGLHRTAVLDRLELAVLRFALARAGCSLGEPTMQATDEDRFLVEDALAKLGRKLGLAAPTHHAPDSGGS